MSEENIQLPSPNFTGDRDNTNFYCFSNGFMLVKQRGSPYALQATYPVNTYVGDVVCTQFDGYYYWSLERQTSGVTLKKWELSNGILYQRDIFSFATDLTTTYYANTFCLDQYSTATSSSVSSGTYTIPVLSVDAFNVGDEIVIGPSTSAANIGEYETRTIANLTSSDIVVDLPLTLEFGSADPIYTTRYFYLFNNYSPYDSTKGSLLRYRVSDGSISSFSSSHLFGDVTASTFYDGYIVFIKGTELVYVSPDTLNVYRNLSISSLRSNRSDIIPIYAIWVYSDVLYRLQGLRVYYDGITEDWKEESWAPYYHYVSESVPGPLEAAVYFVEVKAHPVMLHAIADGVPTAESNIIVTVLNQDRTPLSGRAVTLTSSEGSLVPDNGTTDSNGQFTSVYSGTSSITEVEIKASVV